MSRDRILTDQEKDDLQRRIREDVDWSLAVFAKDDQSHPDVVRGMAAARELDALVPRFNSPESEAE